MKIYKNNKWLMSNMQTMIRILAILITYNISTIIIVAQNNQDSTRVFTEERPFF